MSPRTGLLFLGAPAVPEMVSIAQRAEAAGFESAWVAETRLTRDAMTPAAAIALGTERLRVGTGIVNVYTRNPVLLALTFATLDEIAPGRIVMGLGAGSPLVLAPQGITFDRPLTRLREYCEVIPRLLAGEAVTTAGTMSGLMRRESRTCWRAVAGSGRGRASLYISRRRGRAQWSTPAKSRTGCS